MKLKMDEFYSDRPNPSLLNSVQKLLRTISKTHIHNLYSVKVSSQSRKSEFRVFSIVPGGRALRSFL